MIWNAEFDMLAPGMTESSITVGQSVFYGNSQRGKIGGPLQSSDD